jgi:hypothetical protein
MHEDPAPFAGPRPIDVYAHRLQELQESRADERHREKRLGFSKVSLAGLTVIFAFWLIRHTAMIELLGVPIALYALLAVLHERLLRSIRILTRSIEFYERGIARLEDRWAGCGETGDRFFDSQHLYARDLDLFGKASVFELLSTARTRAGEETLAAWLLAPAPIAEILARQSAICDLAPRVAFRQSLFLLGETVRTGVNPNALAGWGESRPVFPARATRVATSLLALVWVGSLACWGMWGLGWPAAILTLVNLGWSRHLLTRLDQAADAIEDATRDLALLSGALLLLEQEPFTAPKLLELQAALNTGNVRPSAALRKLVRIVGFLEQRRNKLIKPLDRVIFCSAQLLFAAERWQQKFGPQIRRWLAIVGQMEALTSLSAYAYEHPADVFPDFLEPSHGSSKPLFDAAGLAHPLMPVQVAVRSDFSLSAEQQLVILSGPNMAGKSTFIRAIGLNAVLAQCGAPVRAARLRLSPLAVAASICVLDSLSGGVSRFYAEIQKVKRIADLTHGPLPVLFLLDELLSGTNSHDRLAGTDFIVRSFVQRNAVGIVSTHDLALTRIPEAMGPRAANYHFEDRLLDGRLLFDYKLKPGIVQTSNALQLMRSIGLDVAP